MDTPRLIYGMIQSLDGYTEDERGRFGWGAPEDEEVHAYMNALASSVGTYLYGRRMYETMVYWETAEDDPGLPPVAVDWARQWKRADKIVYSRTLTAPRSARTRIEHDFDAEAVRRLKERSTHDLTIDGPEIAAHAIRAGLVDEFQLITCPVIVGGGKRFFPEAVALDLTLLEQRRFGSGIVVSRYGSRAR